MAIALVSSVSAAPGTNGGTTGAIDTTGASLIVIFLADDSGGSEPVVSDNKGNTYTALLETSNGGAAQVVHYCFTPNVGAGHTFTATANLCRPAIFVYAFSGAYGYAGIRSAGNNGSVGPTPCGTVVPTENGSVIFCGLSAYGSATSEALSGFTGLLSLPFSSSVTVRGAAAYLIQTTAASISPSWTWTGSGQFSVGTAVVFAPTSTASGRLSQLPVEVGILSNAPLNARLSQLPVEVGILSDAPIPARLSQLPIEVLINTSVIPSTSTETTQFLIVMP